MQARDIGLLCRPQFPILGRFRNRLAGLLDDRLLDVAELVLAEEHFLSNEESRRAKCSAVDRVGGPIDQPLLDVILLRTDRINVLPINDPIGVVVRGMDSSNVDSVFIAGKARKRRGQLRLPLPARSWSGCSSLLGSAISSPTCCAP